MRLVSPVLQEAVTVVTPGSTTDAYGDVVPDWGAGASRVTYRAWLEQTSSTEVTLGRDTTVADWFLVLPGNATVTATDRIEAEGKTFEVNGAPDVMAGPFGSNQHLELRLRLLVTG